MTYFNGTKVLQEKRYKGFTCIQLDVTTEVRHFIPPSRLQSWTSYEYVWWIEGICGRMRDCIGLTSFAACKRAINEHLEEGQ